MKPVLLFPALCGFLLALAFTQRGVCSALCEPPPQSELRAQTTPEIIVPVRVHLVQSAGGPAMHTTLVEADVRRIFSKVNLVWAQAGIRFEIESIVRTEAAALTEALAQQPEFARVKAMIPRASLSATALNVCYVKEVTPNGFFAGEIIVVKDTARLRPVEGGLDEPLPRVTSHEIGHALSLAHRQDTTNLMASGTTGFSLNEAEIRAAREQAKTLRNAKPPGNPQKRRQGKAAE